METLTPFLLFGGAIFWTAIVIMAVIVIFILCDIFENGFWATAALIALGVVYYLYGDIHAFLSLFNWKTVPPYLVIGLLYSFLRTYIDGRKLGREMLTLPSDAEEDAKKMADYQYRRSDVTKESAKKKYLKKLKNNVARWWFLWPVSLLNWLVTDIFKDLWDTIYHFIKDTYLAILDWGIKSIGK